MSIRTVGAMVACALALAVGSPAAAQDTTVDAPTLEALCAQNAPDAASLQDCLDVVHSILVPGSGPVSGAPGPSLAALVQGAPAGTTLTGDGVDVTLVEADWDPEPGFLAPAEGNQYVAVLTRYLGTAEEATYNFFYWSAVDQDGVTYYGTLGTEPYLESGDVPVGATVEGWVSFDVPTTTTRLDIIQASPFGTETRWTIER